MLVISGCDAFKLDSYAGGDEAEPPVAAKLLWLHAEFLDAAGDSDAADGMFARSYAASGQVWWWTWLAWRDT